MAAAATTPGFRSSPCATPSKLAGTPSTCDTSEEGADDEAAKVERGPRNMIVAHPEGMGSMVALPDDGGATSLQGTIFNLSNTMIGGGILGLPFAYKNYGLLLGTIFLSVTAACMDASAWMILYSLDAMGEATYGMVMEVLYGRVMGVCVDVAVLFNIVGCCTSYMVILGDLVPTFFAYVGAWEVLQDRTSCLSLLALGVLLPLSSMPKMGALRYVSLVCLGVIMVLVGTLLFMGTGVIDVSEPSDTEPLLVGTDITGLVGQFPVLLFAYSCHMNIPILYRELRKQSYPAVASRFTRKRAQMMRAVHTSFVLVCLVYCVAAGGGYVAFRDRTLCDILKNFRPERFPVGPYIKVIYSLAIICSYPVMAFSGCASMHRLLWQCANGCCGDTSEAEGSVPRRKRSKRILGLWRFASKNDTLCRSTSFHPNAQVYAPLDASPTQREGAADGLQAPFLEAGMGRQLSGGNEEVVERGRQVRSDTPVPTRLQQLAEVFVMVIVTTGVAVAVPDLSTVFGLTGSLSCSALMFGFPGLLFLKVKTLEQQQSGQKSGLTASIVLGYLFAGLGLAIAIGSTAVIAWQM